MKLFKVRATALRSEIISVWIEAEDEQSAVEMVEDGQFDEEEAEIEYAPPSEFAIASVVDEKEVGNDS